MYKIIVSVCFACWMFFINSGQAHAISIDALPTTQDVNVNSPVSVNITISGLGDGIAPSIASFDLNIIYDPTMLSFPGMSGVTFGDQLDLWGFGINIQEVDDSTLGTINVSEASFDLPDDLNDMQMSSFILATLTFDTLQVGISTLTIEINALGNANGESLIADSNGAQINVVPIPGAAWLFYSGLVCLMAMRRKRC